MIGIRDESDFQNWFKKNYKNLGFEKIIKYDSMRFPDFIALEKGKKIKIELEIKSSHFDMHGHDPKKVDRVLCIINDKKLEVPVYEVKGLKIIKWDTKKPLYSIKEQIFNLFEKENIKVLTTSEVASLQNISWNTAEKALLELTIDNKVEKIKKEGVNLWVLK